MKYTLSPQHIDEVSEKTRAFLAEQAVAQKDAMRIRLGVEEALLRFQDHFGSDASFEFDCGKSLGKTRIVLRVNGEMFDPYRRDENGETVSSFLRSALADVGELPTWRYSFGNNILTFVPTRKTSSDLTLLLIAVIAAVVLGLIFKTIPSDVSSFFTQTLLTPLLDTFMDFMGAMAGPMIFLAVVYGIYSVGDVATFNELGKRLLGRYLINVTVATIVFFHLITPLFNLVEGASSTSAISTFSSLLDLVLDIVPDNIFTPFTEGNTLRIVFVAIIIGIAMLYASEKTQTVALLMEQVNVIVQIIMNAIGKLVPFFVFGSLLNIIANENLSDISQFYKLLFVNIAGCACLLVFYTIYLCLRVKIRPHTFIKKALPTFIISITTASSAAAFATNCKTCNESYGIQKKLSDFGVPFGQVLLKPSMPLLYFTSALCAAEIFGIESSANWLITVFFISIILSFATPPIPGGQLASFAVLFSQLAIPNEGISLVLTIAALLDFLETPTDLFVGQSLLILAAKKFNMLDEDVLRK